MMKSLVFVCSMLFCCFAVSQSGAVLSQSPLHAAITAASTCAQSMATQKAATSCKPASCKPSNCPPVCPPVCRPCPTGNKAAVGYASQAPAATLPIVMTVYREPVAEKDAKEDCPPGCCKK